MVLRFRLETAQQGGDAAGHQAPLTLLVHQGEERLGLGGLAGIGVILELSSALAWRLRSSSGFFPGRRVLHLAASSLMHRP